MNINDILVGYKTMKKIYFAMLEFDIGCFEFDKIFDSRKKAEDYMKKHPKKIREIYEADLE